MKPTKRTLGQVMVLSVVTMLITVLMLMLSFSLTQTIHEKIRLQSHSDAMAYSMATVEARAMNYFAYSNRAIAAVAVSEMTIHAYMATMSASADAFNAAFIAFLEIMGMEFGECLACCPYCCLAHCGHAFEALDVAFQFKDKGDDLANDVQNREGDFNRAIEAYSMFLDVIHGGQLSVLAHTSDVLAGKQLDSLQKINAPRASPLPTGVAAMNLREFACAMEGTPIDMLCFGGNSKSSTDARSKTIANVANAARGEWPKSSPFFPLLWHPETLEDLMTDIQSDGFTTPFVDSGSAKAMDSHSSGDCTGDGNSQKGATICGVQKGFLVSFYQDTPPGFMVWGGEVYSDDGGGAHKPGSTHSGKHDKWHGFEHSETLPDCITDGECFINFRSSKDEPYGQPMVYGYFEQNLRENSKGNHGQWELGTDGKLTLNDGMHSNEKTDNGVLDLVPRNTGAAVSKGMVYFHRPDDWQMPPNMFDPYWKAKLHPFKSTEVAEVLTAAMNLKAAENALGPVEGQDP